MDFTLLQVNARPDDVTDAIGLLAPDWAGGTVVGYPDFWSVVPITPAGARTLAPRLAPMLGVRVVTVTLTADVCALSLVTPDGTAIGPLDGRSPAGSDAFVAAFRKQNAGELVAALADGTRSPAERHRTAAKLLGLPLPDFDEMQGRPGVLVVGAPAEVVRDRLPFEGHGGWVLPYGPDQTLVVPDGTGAAPRPDTFLPALATRAERPLPTVAVNWGDRHTLTAASQTGNAEVDLSEQSAEKLAPAGGKVAAALGRPELAGEIDAALASWTDPDDRAVAMLRVLSGAEPPVGTNVERLASWASTQPDAVRVPARDTAPTLRHSDPAELTAQLRRRRTIRRTRRGVLVFTVAAGAAVVYSWSEAKFGWLLPAGGVFVVLLLIWILLGRLAKTP